jgi:hypothetical protein
MIRLGWWTAAIATMFILWQECGENPAVFCYRMGVTLCGCVPGEVSLLPSASAQRMPLACSKQSAASYILSTMSKD